MPLSHLFSRTDRQTRCFIASGYRITKPLWQVLLGLDVKDDHIPEVPLYEASSEEDIRFRMVRIKCSTHRMVSSASRLKLHGHIYPGYDTSGACLRCSPLPMITLHISFILLGSKELAHMATMRGTMHSGQRCQQTQSNTKPPNTRVQRTRRCHVSWHTASGNIAVTNAGASPRAKTPAPSGQSAWGCGSTDHVW